MFVGTPDGLEARLVPEAGITFEPLPARGFDRWRPLSLPTAAAVIAASTVRAVGLLRRYRPDVVIGFGGYASLPAGIAAVLSGVPLVLHEQNSVPGLANRVLSRWACGVGVTYEDSARFLAHPGRAVLTGNPVRRDVLLARRDAARRSLGYAEDDLVLLVFGGSRGARHVNEAMMNLYPRLKDVRRLRVLHAAGRMEAPQVRQRLAEMSGDGVSDYRVVDYLEDMGSALAAADLVVARAGATSIAEITALGRPALLVPYPHATGDHQTLNARALERSGAAVVIADSEIDGARFGGELMSLLKDAERRARMAAAAASVGRVDAARRVTDIAREASGEERPAARRG